MPVLWAGKKLDAEEELSLRRVVALLRRIEEANRNKEERENARNDRMNLERFLPEDDLKWTPDQLEFGAHNGPSFYIGEVAVAET